MTRPDRPLDHSCHLSPETAHATARDLSPETAHATARDLSPGTARATARDLSPGTAHATARDLSPGTAHANARDLSPGTARTARDLSPGTARATARLLPTFAAALALLSFGTADAAPQRLAPPAAGDLHAPAARASSQPSQAPVGGPASFVWPIDQAADDLDERPASHIAESTGHAQTATAAALRAGLPLPISRPGAFIKVSPQAGVAAAISVLAPDGRQHTIGDGLTPVGRADGGAFTLDPALGTGVFELRLTASADVRIDVLERGSDLVLLAQAASDVVFVGDELQVEARLLHRGQPAPADRVTATLHAPDGRTLTRTLTRARDGSYRARLPVRGASGPAGQPWQVDLQADARVDGRPVRRTTTTAVAVSVPTARPTGVIELTRPREAVRAELELEVASPGRYAVTAVLYGRNRDGQLQPIAVGQSADQLEPGRRALALEFDAATIDASGLRGPFELRDLRLVDQGRMFVLHRQAR